VRSLELLEKLWFLFLNIYDWCFFDLLRTGNKGNYKFCVLTDLMRVEYFWIE
jgi:hypothetical protein